MKVIEVVVVLLILLFSCGHSGRRIYIISNDGAGLQHNSVLFDRGVEVGHISDISLYKNRVLITLQLKAGYAIQRNAMLLVTTKDLTSKVIEVLDNNKKGGVITDDTLYVNLGYESKPVR